MDHIDVMMVHERQRELTEEMNRIKLAGMAKRHDRRRRISLLHALLVLFHSPSADRHPVQKPAHRVWRKH